MDQGKGVDIGILDDREADRREQVRESLTMALYVGLSLQAVLLVTPTPDADADNVGAAVTIFLTALSLLVAHQVAVRLSTKFTNQGLLDGATLRSLRAQSLGGLPVAFIAAAPVLVWGSAGLVIAELLLLSFVAVVGFLAARSRGATRTRSFGYVLGVVLVVAGVLALKILVKH